MNLNRPLIPLLLCFLGAWLGRADTLYFIASPAPDQTINYNFYSPGNWYVPDGTGGWAPAARTPISTDNAILLTSANAAANSVNLLGLFLEPDVHVAGGNFAVVTLGTAAGASFTSSTIEVRNSGYITNDLTIYGSTLTVDSGAFLLLMTGSSVLAMDTSVVYNVGQIVLTSGSMMNFVGGTNQLWIRPSAVISGSGSTSIAVSGSGAAVHLDFYYDGTLRSDLGVMTLTLPNTTWLCTQGLAKFRTAASTAAIELHGPMAVPPNSTNLVVGPGITRFFGDATSSTVSGVLQIGAIDPTTSVLDPGTLEMDRVLTGTGMVYTVSSAGLPSTFIWGNGTITVPVLSIDPFGNFLITNSFSKVLSAGTINNAGFAVWSSDHGDIHLNNGAVFNNLATGTFDARNNAALYGGVGALGTFNNLGIFRKTAGTGDTYVWQDNPPAPGATFNNSGLVAAQIGRILLMGGTNSGQFSMDAGARISIWGFTNFQVAGASFVGAGTLSAGGSSPVLWLEANCTIPNLDLESTAAIDGPGDLEVSQSLLMVSASLRGSGRVNILAGATFNATNAQSSSLGRDVSNAGTAVTGSTLFATRAVTWSNAPGGSLAFFGPSGGLDVNYTGPLPTLLNYGSLFNLATNSPLVNWLTTNAGTIQVNAYGLKFNQDFIQL
ncbi:MAG TPA: hypothetical protein VHI52_04155, partial [Verrucomicrobiae bacterium]|nr:hypothetical protein [Verrucomicrobiae bacterium]